MEGINRIVIPVDNTEDSEKAVKKGSMFAKLLKLDVVIITVNDTHQFISSVVIEEKLKNEAQAFLDKFKKIGEEIGVKMDTKLISGQPVEEIVNFVKNDDLLIMAHHDRTKGIDKFMETSVSRDVVRNAKCSVLVLK